MSFQPFHYLHRPVADPTPVIATDLEGTLTATATWEGMRDYLRATGRNRDFQRFFRARLWSLIRYRLGLGDATRLKSEWIRGLLYLFAGDTRAQMHEMGEWVAENTLWPTRRRALQHELDGLAAEGRRIVIVSGMFAPILTAAAVRFGYEAIGTPLIYNDEIFSGECGELNIREHKAEVVRLFPVVVRAYGDTAADIPMLRAAAAAVAVFPDPTLRAAALEAGWRIFDA